MDNSRSLLRVQLCNYSRRITTDHGPRFHVFCYYGSGRNDCSTPDSYSLHDGGLEPNPRIILDSYRSRNSLSWCAIATGKNCFSIESPFSPIEWMAVSVVDIYQVGN